MTARLLSAVVPAVAAVIASPTLASAADCYTTIGCVESAKSARSFAESVGVNTHLGYMDTIYNQRWGDIIKPRLLELGASHVRDGTFPAGYSSGPTVASRYRELGRAGLGLNLLVGHEQAQGSATALSTRLGWIKNEGLAPYIVGLEGSNEFRTDGGDPARVESLRSMQRDIWTQVKNDPTLGSKLVIGPSSGDAWSDDIWYREIGDLSAHLDRGNLHPYPGEDPPHMRLGRDPGVAMEWGRTTYGSKPYWSTENGYWNKSPDGSHLSEWAAGVYIPRMVLESFRRGIERTQLYELIDLNTNTLDVIHNYGLVRTDGTPKPAFTGLANLMRTVEDTEPASGSLGFGIVCKANCHSPIRHVLLRQSSGVYVLAVWSESRVWNGSTDTPQPAQGVDLLLHETPETVELINPAGSATPFRTETGAKTIDTNVTDHVRLFRITPAAASPPPAPPTTAMSFEAEAMKVTPWFSVYPEPGLVQDDPSADGGRRLTMRHFGAASQSIDTTSKANRLTVRARGDQCSGAPTMTVKVDGATAGTRAVTATSWAEHTVTISAPAGRHTVEISYDNDYEDAACNRNLHLDSVAFSFVPPATSFEAEGMTVGRDYSWSDPNPGRVQSDSTASGGQRLMLWTYGSASKSLTTDHAYKKVVVRARGDLCDGAPEAWLKVDGATVAKHVVSSTGWADYTAVVSVPAGNRTIAVQYPYDYESAACNRNLHLDKITLDNGS